MGNEERAVVTPSLEAMGGPVNMFLPSGQLNLNALRTNATLRKEEWEELDLRVVDVARQRLNAVADLRAAGLVLNLGGIGTTISQYEQMGDMSAANIDMSGVAPGVEDRLTFELISIPVPVIHKDFRLNIRHLEASRRLGQSIDVSTAGVAARRVADALEGLVFNGDTGIVVNGNALEGYTTATNRNTGTASGDWGTIANIYTDCNSMVQDAEAAYYFGPYTMYVAATQFGQMRAIYTDGSGESAFQRVLRGIPQISTIKPSDTLTAGSVLLIQMSSEVVDLAVAQDISTIEWNTMGGLVRHFKVWAVMAPRVKNDANSASGIVHYTGA